jgi:hypothetical protein
MTMKYGPDGGDDEVIDTEVSDADAILKRVNDLTDDAYALAEQARHAGMNETADLLDDVGGRCESAIRSATDAK